MAKIIGKKKSKNVANKYGNVKLTYKGVKFNSKLEVFMYKQLELLKTPFKYEGQSYTVLPGFIYNGEKVRPITYKPDFRLDNYPVIIETKGRMNDSLSGPYRGYYWKYKDKMEANLKSGELQETPKQDNLQPSLGSE